MRATCDLPPALQDAVATIAKRKDTSASQVVALFLRHRRLPAQRTHPHHLRGRAHPRQNTPLFLEPPDAADLDHLGGDPGRQDSAAGVKIGSNGWRR
ncbi:MAG: hypothetical protein ACKO9F_19945 [Caldilinea sp.]